MPLTKAGWSLQPTPRSSGLWRPQPRPPRRSRGEPSAVCLRAVAGKKGASHCQVRRTGSHHLLPHRVLLLPFCLCGWDGLSSVRLAYLHLTPPCFSPGDVLDLNPEAGDRARHWVSSGAHVEMSRAIGWGDVKRADPAPLSWTLGLPGADVDEAVRPRVRLVHEIKEGDGLGHQVTPLCQHCTPAPN